MIGDHANQAARGNLRVHVAKGARPNAAANIAEHELIKVPEYALEERAGELVSLERNEQQQPGGLRVFVVALQNQFAQAREKGLVVARLRVAPQGMDAFGGLLRFGFNDGVVEIAFGGEMPVKDRLGDAQRGCQFASCGPRKPFSANRRIAERTMAA